MITNQYELSVCTDWQTRLEASCVPLHFTSEYIALS